MADEKCWPSPFKNFRKYRVAIKYQGYIEIDVGTDEPTEEEAIKAATRDAVDWLLNDSPQKKQIATCEVVKTELIL